MATTGTKRILDIQPTSIHERTSVFLGSKEDVTDLMKFYEAEAAPKENGTSNGKAA